MKKAIVIDGNSLMYRMFYATVSLAEYAIKNNLIPVNAVKLMIETCLKLKQYNYDYCLIAFDHDKKTSRHELLQDYKAGRKKMPDALVQQIPLIKESLELIGFNIMSWEGNEADDLIGSFAKLMNEKDIFVDVYSSDKDMLQIVNKNCNVNLIKTGLTNIIINTVDNFLSLNNGLCPSQIPDYKSVVGDKSDNLSGVNGIGEKTGIDLIIKFGSLQNIYDNLNQLTPKMQTKFNESKEIAFLCKQLATINCKLFINKYNVEDFLFKPQKNNELISFLRKYKINGIEKYLSNQMQIFE